MILRHGFVTYQTHAVTDGKISQFRAGINSRPNIDRTAMLHAPITTLANSHCATYVLPSCHTLARRRTPPRLRERQRAPRWQVHSAAADPVETHDRPHTLGEQTRVYGR